MKNSNKTTVLTMVVSLLVAFVLVMSGPEGSIINSNYVYAAKSSGGGGSSDGGGGGGGSGGGVSGSHSSKGGSNGGGKSGGGGKAAMAVEVDHQRLTVAEVKVEVMAVGLRTKASGGDSGKGSDNGDSGTTGSGGIRTFGTTDGGDNAGGGTTGSDGGGLRIGIPHNPNDDGFTNKDGPQPGFPQPPKNCFGFKCGDKGGGGGDDHKNFFCRIHPRACDHGGGDGDNHHDNVKVIHRTVVVHDRDNNQQTIIVNANTAGTCFVTQTQIVNIPGLVAQLLDQCASVTIVPG